MNEDLFTILHERENYIFWHWIAFTRQGRDQAMPLMGLN